MQKQTTTFNKESVEKKCYIVDASTLPLGRLASAIAVILKGKHKAEFTPNADLGDFVIVINSKNVVLTGGKLTTKNYYNLGEQRPGSLRVRTAKTMKEKYSNEMVYRAVKGMLPKGRLGRQMIKKLFVYEDENHRQQGLNPVVLEIK